MMNVITISRLRPKSFTITKTTIIKKQVIQKQVLSKVILHLQRLILKQMDDYDNYNLSLLNEDFIGMSYQIGRILS